MWGQHLFPEVQLSPQLCGFQHSAITCILPGTKRYQAHIERLKSAFPFADSIKDKWELNSNKDQPSTFRK